MLLLGITGFKRNGKDSLADCIIRQYGYTKRSLAGKMKDCLYTIFGWDEEFVEQNKEKIIPEWGISPRQFLQTMGTEFAQYQLCEKYPEFYKVTGRKLWVRSLLNELSEVSKKYTVISDVRFPHEADEIRAHGGKIIRVVGGYVGCPPPDLSHESERAVDSVYADVVVLNGGTLEDLDNTAKELKGFIYGN
jgi:hypothetical protein